MPLTNHESRLCQLLNLSVARPSSLSTDLESKAKEALIDDHFGLTVTLYSQAIDICPSNVDLIKLDRAQASSSSTLLQMERRI